MGKWACCVNFVFGCSGFQASCIVMHACACSAHASICHRLARFGKGILGSTGHWCDPLRCIIQNTPLCKQQSTHCNDCALCFRPLQWSRFSVSKIIFTRFTAIIINYLQHKLPSAEEKTNHSVFFLLHRFYYFGASFTLSSLFILFVASIDSCQKTIHAYCICDNQSGHGMAAAHFEVAENRVWSGQDNHQTNTINRRRRNAIYSKCDFSIRIPIFASFVLLLLSLCSLSLSLSLSRCLCSLNEIKIGKYKNKKLHEDSGLINQCEFIYVRCTLYVYQINPTRRFFMVDLIVAGAQ